ncbi:hypothetical protein CEW46_27465, partial [Bacillus cereus]
RTIIEYPVLLSASTESYGYKFRYRLPVGLTHDAMYKIIPVIEGATNSEIEVDHDGQEVELRFLSHPIPEPGSPEASYDESWIEELRKYPLAYPVGCGRLGKVFHTPFEGPYPHMMIGGQTGTGKSTYLNFVITCLLKAYSVDRVKLVLVDTKMVEFNDYKYHKGVYQCSLDVEAGVRSAHYCYEVMEQREILLKESGCKNIVQYNKLVEEYNTEHPDNLQQYMEYLVMICDEYGDFRANSDFWDPVEAIGRKGRAMGVHLILATQRPSADTLPPNVKSNLAAVVALKVRSTINSQMLLDNNEAFNLPNKIGRGIYQLDKPVTVQTPYIAESAIEKELGIVINRQLKVAVKNETVEDLIKEVSESLESATLIQETVTKLEKFTTEEVTEVRSESIKSSNKIIKPKSSGKKIEIKKSKSTPVGHKEKVDYDKLEFELRTKITQLEAEATLINQKYINPVGKEVHEVRELLRDAKSEEEKKKLKSRGKSLMSEYELYVSKRDTLLVEANQLKSKVNEVLIAKNEQNKTK